MPDITVAICTRDRPAQLRASLAALEAQSFQDFRVLVIDQSAGPHADTPASEWQERHLRLLRDPGRGLSRARNLALRTAETPWIAFVDDDCLLEPDWIEQLRRVVEEHPEVSFVTGHVGVANVPAGDHLAAAARGVHTEQVVGGRWTRPHELGFGVCMALRREVALALGGWDERLGAGNEDFPAGEDVDFNYRLTRSGHLALASPRMRAAHDQWRSPADTVRLYRGYGAAAAAFPVKHFRSGDPLGGTWLWLLAAIEVLRLLASGVRHRSRLRLRVALAQAAGFARGTALAARRQWD